MKLKNTIANQHDWLQNLPAGSQVIKGMSYFGDFSPSVYFVKLEMPEKDPHRNLGFCFCNIKTGEIVHYSSLANVETPPRLESFPTPFKE